MKKKTLTMNKYAIELLKTMLKLEINFCEVFEGKDRKALLYIIKKLKEE